LVPLEPPHPVPIRDARREGKPGQLVPPYELALADFARHLSVSARQRTAGAYLDTLQRLLGFGLDPLQAERSELERFLSRNRRGRWGDYEGPLSSSTQTAELAALRRFFRWARAEGLRPDDPTEGIRPPRREPYARARGLSAEEVGRLLAAIPVESAAGLRLRALVLAYLLTGRRRSALARPLPPLRHSYARALRRSEAPLEAVQAALDHSNLATTSIYLRQLEGQEDPWWPKLAAELGLQAGGEAAPPAEEQR